MYIHERSITYRRYGCIRRRSESDVRKRRRRRLLAVPRDPILIHLMMILVRKLLLDVTQEVSNKSGYDEMKVMMIVVCLILNVRQQ